MKDKKRKYILMIILLGVLMLLSGCVRKECEEKVKDLEFTVTKEEELPEALRQQIEACRFRRQGLNPSRSAGSQLLVRPLPDDSRERLQPRCSGSRIKRLLMAARL